VRCFIRPGGFGQETLGQDGARGGIYNIQRPLGDLRLENVSASEWAGRQTESWGAGLESHWDSTEVTTQEGSRTAHQLEDRVISWVGEGEYEEEEVEPEEEEKVDSEDEETQIEEPEVEDPDSVEEIKEEKKEELSEDGRSDQWALPGGPEDRAGERRAFLHPFLIRHLALWIPARLTVDLAVWLWGHGVCWSTLLSQAGVTQCSRRPSGRPLSTGELRTGQVK
jgi:hypothetical protein